MSADVSPSPDAAAARVVETALPKGWVWAELLAGRVPEHAATGGDLDLIGLYGPIVADPQVVVGQMAQSLDGFIATTSGDGAGLSGAEDHVHLHRLRALCDAVVVGVGTVVADDPQLTVRECEGANPVRVVLDPQGRAPVTSRVLTRGDAPTLWVLGPDADPTLDAGSTAGDDTVTHDATAPHVEIVRLAGTTPAEILAALRARGLARVLVEGGGRTVSRFLADGCLRRLHLTSVPVLLGAGVRGVQVDAAASIADAKRHPSRRFVLGEDVCTDLELC